MRRKTNEIGKDSEALVQRWWVYRMSTKQKQ